MPFSVWIDLLLEAVFKDTMSQRCFGHQPSGKCCIVQERVGMPPTHTFPLQCWTSVSVSDEIVDGHEGGNSLKGAKDAFLHSIHYVHMQLIAPKFLIGQF